MKVALVLDDLQVGGIERVCLDYCKLFLNLGYEVTVFNLHPKLNQLEKEIPQGVNVVNIPFSSRVTPERYTKLIKRNYIFRIAYIFIYFLLSILDFFYKIFCKTVYKECREQFDYAISFSSHFNDLTFVADHFVRSKNYMSWCHGAIYSYLLMSDGFINLYNNKNLKLNIYKLYNPSFVKNRPIDDEKVNRLKEKYGKYLLMVSRFQYPHKDQFTVIKAFNILIKKNKIEFMII